MKLFIAKKLTESRNYMDTTLEIRDGEPYWWNSPDIWVVPGNDPNGPTGQPIAGEPAFLWCRVYNTGERNVSNVRVNYYWSNPTTGVLRSNSIYIGSSFVNLNPKESKEVPCIIPWIPEIVNNGHECVIVEIVHPIDPLPSPLPDEFNAPNYHQIAQNNLTVLDMVKNMMLMTIQLAAPIRKEKLFCVTTKIGGELDSQNLVELGLGNYRPAMCDTLKVGLSLIPSCEEYNKEEMKKEVKLLVKPGTAKAVYLKIWPQELKPKTYELLHIISRDEEGIEGGMTCIIINSEEE